MSNTQTRALAQRLRTAAAALQEAYGQIPLDCRDWRPGEEAQAQSVSDHVGECAYRSAWAAAAFRAGAAPVFDIQDCRRQAERHGRQGDSLEWLQEGMAALAAAVEAFPPARLAEALTSPLTGQTTTWAELGEFLYWNAAYHEGQINDLHNLLRQTPAMPPPYPSRRVLQDGAGKDNAMNQEHSAFGEEPSGVGEQSPDLRDEPSALGRRLTVLADRFSDLAGRMLEAAKAMEISGVLPPAEFMDELLSARTEFLSLRQSVLALAESVGVSPLPAPEHLDSVTALHPVLQAVGEVKQKESRAERTRQGALALLGQVLAIRHRDEAAFPPLAACQAEASALRGRISEADWSQLPDEADALASGAHIYATLVTLVASDAAVDDEQWVLLQEAVEESLGKALSVAAARGKLVVSADSDAVDSRPKAPQGLELLPVAPAMKPAEEDKKGKRAGFRFGRMSLP